MADAVTLAYLHSNEVAHSFHQSVVNLALYDLTSHQRLMRGGYISMRCGSGGLVQGRNKTFAQFLEQSTADWLFFVDTDIGFQADTLDRLVAAADPDDRPVVGGLYFAWRELEQDDTYGFRCAPSPVMHHWVKTADGKQLFAWATDYQPDTVQRVAGTGCGCLLVHRTVIEKVKADYGPTWFDRIVADDGQLISEDLSFCARVGAIGSAVHVHTGIKCTHLKELWVSEADWHNDQALRRYATEQASAGG